LREDPGDYFMMHVTEKMVGIWIIFTRSSVWPCGSKMKGHVVRIP